MVRGDQKKRAEYMKEYWRKASVEKKERKTAIMRARSRALTRLSGLHHDDFVMILQDELIKEGLKDVEVRGMRKTGVSMADDQSDR